MRSFSIGSVARLTGLSQFILRAWESRYEMAQPKRTPTGRRVYSESDVERLTLLRLATEQGHAIGDIADLNAVRLTALLEKGSVSGPGASKVLAALEKTLSSLEITELSSVLRTAQLHYDTRTFLLHVLSPFMRRIGQRVADGDLDIFHEHAASAIVRNILTGILYSTERSSRWRVPSPVVFATPEGDLHEFGILIAAVLTALKGLRVFYLGPNIPARSLVKGVIALKSELAVVAMSAPEVSMPSAVLIEYMRALRGELPPQTQLWLAGSRSAEPGILGAVRTNKIRLVTSFDDFEGLIAKAGLKSGEASK